MDIFNLQKVEELEREIASLKHKLCEAESRANKAERSLERFLELIDTAPKDCTSGTYCKACEFVKEFCYHDYWNGPILNSNIRILRPRRMDGFDFQYCGSNLW